MNSIVSVPSLDVHEEFELFVDGTEDARAEYKADEGCIVYYMPYLVDGYGDLIRTISHEWFHACLDWASENTEWRALLETHDKNANHEHKIMMIINYD